MWSQSQIQNLDDSTVLFGGLGLGRDIHDIESTW